MIRGNKLENYIERVNGDHRPITADVFLTDYCNNRCTYCRYNHDTGKYISLNDFKSYVLRLLQLGVKGIILTGGGEPSVNPHFEEICHWLEEKHIDYGVNTNLNIMKRVNPNFLKVSIDSGDAAEYAAIRGKDTLHVVLNNLKEYIEFRNSTGSKTKIGVQCVATSVRQAKSFYEAVKSFGVDYIQFRPLETAGKNLDYAEVLDYIDSLGDKRIVKSFKFNLLDYRTESCISNWSIITVNTAGKIPYCCHRPDDIVGSIYDDDILEKLATHQIDTRTCEKPCRLSGTNQFLETYKPETDQSFV